ncbi:membrane protein [Streptococcus mitis 17/34]|nr:membrane protein [Streptococcus mitis 17/34]
MMRKLIVFLLMLPFLGLWLELHVLVNNLLLNLEIPLDFVISMGLTFCSLIFSKIVLDLLYALKDVYKKEGLITIFPFIFIGKKKVNVRFSPYFSFHRKSLSTDDLKSRIIWSFILEIAIIIAFIFKMPIVLIVLITIFFWNIMDINHLVFNKTEFLFNQNKWQKEDSFDRDLTNTLKDKIQKSELRYSDLMCILLYDAINQSTFLTDSEIFEDILKKIEDFQNPLLCTGLAELLMYEITISKNHNWPEKVNQIRVKLIKINQLEFYYYTSWLRNNFNFCMNREYDKMKSRRIFISNKKII